MRARCISFSSWRLDRLLLLFIVFAVFLFGAIIARIMLLVVVVRVLIGGSLVALRLRLVVVARVVGLQRS